MGHFGLFFIGSSDQLFLSTAGAGQPFSGLGVSDLADRLQRLMTAMASDPEGPLSSLDVLNPGERVRLDEVGNRAVLARPAPDTLSVPELFAAKVADHPDAVALSFAGGSMTYRLLDEASNRMAHLLAAQGIGPGEQVALLSGRSAHAVIAILAVLKSGATYLPIDPAVPTRRIEFVLADATPMAAITTAELRPRLDGFDLLVLDVDDPRVAEQPSTPLPAPDPACVAYVIYTSGTTGTPKGVAVTHGNLTQLMTSFDATALPRRGVWAHSHSLGFDASVWEIGHALLRGGRLVVVPEAVAASPEDFHRLLVGEEVTALTQTPSAVAMLSPEGLESTTSSPSARRARPRW